MKWASDANYVICDMKFWSPDCGLITKHQIINCMHWQVIYEFINFDTCFCKRVRVRVRVRSSLDYRVEFYSSSAHTWLGSFIKTGVVELDSFTSSSWVELYKTSSSLSCSRAARLVLQPYTNINSKWMIINLLSKTGFSPSVLKPRIYK